jgi:hypothetical protein
MIRTQESQDRVEVSVGKGRQARIFLIHKNLACQYSDYFRAACTSGMSEATTGKFELEEQDLVVFLYFAQWLYSKNKVITTKQQVLSLDMNDQWQIIAVQAWMLGDRLLCQQFSLYAFGKFCQCVESSKLSRILQVYHNKDSRLQPLQRFTAAWLSYVLDWPNASKPELARTHKQLKKTKGFKYSSHVNTLDPRRYIMDHWFRACGSEIKADSRTCAHIPKGLRQRIEKPIDRDVWLDPIPFP